MSAHLRAVGRCCFWHGTPLKMRPVRQEAVHSLWSRLLCGPLKMRSMWQVLFRAPLKTHRVPQEPFFVTECLRKRFAYHRRLFCAPNISSVPEKPVFGTARFRKTHRTWLSGAQKSGWQLPLRGLSTPGRGRGNGPPETSSALAGRRKWWKGSERTK